jgi:hypothetical protein
LAIDIRQQRFGLVDVLVRAFVLQVWVRLAAIPRRQAMQLVRPISGTAFVSIVFLRPEPTDDVGMESVDCPHCRWCGEGLDGARLYCGRAHRRAQQRHRQRLIGEPLKRCPTQAKTSYSYRGTALRYAAWYRQSPYRCGCGVFHLTSRRLPYAAGEIAVLARKLHQRWFPEDSEGIDTEKRSA